ncbi:MAG: hypothetical protein P9M11_00565 [Candidatus Tenebribacter burtonii]|jgi:phenylacetate-CoA ligase|nr:hypothetical protein [Candidatus Tenebribacter burtonii]
MIKLIRNKSKIAIRLLKKNAYLHKILKNNKLPRHKLKEIQLIKFRKVLIYAYENVEFYKHKYDEASYNPYTFRTERNVLDIPMLTKEEIRENFPNRIFAKGIDMKKCIIDHTSGSTSEPLKYLIDPHNKAIRDAIHEYVRRIAGWKKNNILLLLRTPQSKNIDEVNGTRRIFSISPHSDIATLLQLFNSLKPDFIFGEPSFLYKIAIELDGLNYAFKTPLKGILSTGEMLIPVMKDRIEKSFNAKIFDSYGCGETVDVACECKSHNGMHEIMEHAYIEILKDQKPAKEMESGNVLITDLDNYAMPFIRYNLNDVARRSFEYCSCGITSPLIKISDGRVQDFLVSKDNRMISPFTFTGFISPFYNEPLRSMIDQYQIVQDTKKDITLNIALQKKIDINTKNGLIEFTKHHLGNVKVTIKMFEKLPQKKYEKFRCVVSKAYKNLDSI